MEKFAEGFKDIDERCHNYDFYIMQRDELKTAHIEQIPLVEFVDKLFNSKHFGLLKSMFKNIDEKFLYKSDIHGKMHNFRVSLFAVFIADALAVSEEDLKVLLYATMYHDIGRKNDLKDLGHGALGASIIDKLGLQISFEESQILKCVIASHSLWDSDFQDVEKKYEIKDEVRCRRIYQILKDADALDRVRLGKPYIKIDFLRTNIAEHLILTAYQLEHNTDLIFRAFVG